MTATPKPDPGVSFTREEGVVHIGGIDALVRLTLDQVRADKRRGLQHRHVRLGLPRLARGHARRRVHQAAEAAAREPHPLRRRHQRGPGRHRGVGHADAALRRQQEVRRRHRHVVRQGAGRRPQRRCAQACELHRHRQERRRARRRRRRPELQVLVAVQPVRADAVPRRHPVAVSRQRAGDPRPGPARLPDVAPVRAVGRPEDRHQRRRRLEYGRSLAGAPDLRHARPRCSTASPSRRT